ncbi:MAG: DNA polymerase beta superfamily protein [Phycisphaerales bacterium JB039]
MIDPALAQPYLEGHPWPLLFVTVSGAHLYGFPSADSDYDLRGAHITPVREMARLSPPRATHEVMDAGCAVEMDLVTHDVHKFFRMLLNRNGYVLEQIFSPLVVLATPEFEELKAIAPRCLTRHHRHHFRSFAQNQWDRVMGAAGPTVKGLLYTYRPLMAGIYLMEEKRVESNLRTLNERFGFSFVDDLIAAKVAGAEKQAAPPLDMDFHRQQFDRLAARLEDAAERSGLPEQPVARAELDDLLVRLRMATITRKGA